MSFILLYEQAVALARVGIIHYMKTAFEEKKREKSSIKKLMVRKFELQGNV